MFVLVPANLLPAYTLLHVAISLIAIASGLVVLYGYLNAKDLRGWTAVFLWTTVLTSVTGFGFPITKLTPGLVFGVISLIVLAPTIYAYYAQNMAGRWRLVYVIGSVIALYINVLVLVAQSFQKIPRLHALAPTQSEPPFMFAQGIALGAFLVFGVLAAKRFKGPSVSAG
jgi:hypothetical protein